MQRPHYARMPPRFFLPDLFPFSGTRLLTILASLKQSPNEKRGHVLQPLRNRKREHSEVLPPMRKRAQANAQSNSAPSAFEQEISASKGRQGVANFLRAFQAHVAPQAKNYSVLNAQCSQMEMFERQRADFEKRVKSPVLLILGIVLIALGIGDCFVRFLYASAHRRGGHHREPNTCRLP